MKFFRLLIKSLFRNRLRTLLTVSSIAAALFLVATLLAVLFQLTSPPDTPDSALRLIVRHRVSLFNILPNAYRERISGVDGVEAVIGSMWFGGMYDDKGVDTMLGQFAVDTDGFFTVNPDMRLPDDQKDAFVENRSSALVGKSVADRFDWKVGDTIHTKSNLFAVEPVELKIAGIYEGGGDDGGGVYFHWTYFNEAMGDPGFTGTFSVRVSNPELVPSVAEKIDDLFKNSSAPTKTETEKAFIMGFISMLGNVQLLFTGICSAVMFAVLLVAANTMAMAIRERVREIGILKALGFRRSHVLGLLLTESLLVGLTGTAIGALGAKFIFSGVNMAAVTGGYLQSLRIDSLVLSICLALGLLIGVLSAGVPALRAAQRPVLDSLRSVI